MTEGDTYSIMRGGGTRQGAEQEHHMQRLERQYMCKYINTIRRVQEHHHMQRFVRE